jgi:hypothetical protein
MVEQESVQKKAFFEGEEDGSKNNYPTRQNFSNRYIIDIYLMTF